MRGTICSYWIILPSLVSITSSELVIQRMSGLQPDRFTDTEHCEADTCSRMYDAGTVVPDSCQCVCPQNKSTFSLSHLKCLHLIPDCANLSLAPPPADDAGPTSNQTNSGDASIAQSGVFTVLLSRGAMKITPKLPVRHAISGDIYHCDGGSIVSSVMFETPEGFSQDSLEFPHITINAESKTNLSFIKFSANTDTMQEQRLETGGLLMRIEITCSSTSSNYCLPLKIHGFQKADISSLTTSSTTEDVSSSVLPQRSLSPTSLAFIIGGVIVGLIVLLFVTVAVVICCGNLRQRHRQDEGVIKVKRVERNISINSSNKNPLTRIYRDFVVGPSYKEQKQKDFVRLSVSTNGDSGRGMSYNSVTTPSPTSQHTSDTVGGMENRAFTEALSQYESMVISPREIQPQQWKLFKTHEDKLSTARQGITGITSSREEKKPTRPSIKQKLSALGKIIRGKNLERSQQHSESRLSIDYDQFCITAADGEGAVNPPAEYQQDNTIPQRKTSINRLTEGKRFSESHINPEISFTVEGRLAETEELVLPLGTPTQSAHMIQQHSVPEMYSNDLYDSEHPASSTSQSLNLDPHQESLPVTSIDDVIEASSDFEVYEHIK